MPTMTYSGKSRTVRCGPRVYHLSRGTFEANVQDVAALSEVGAKLKQAGGSSAADDDGAPQEG